MGKNFRMILLGLGALGASSLAPISIHYAERNSEQGKLDVVQQLVQQVERDRTAAKQYLSDGVVTPSEAYALYWICRDPADRGVLRDSQFLTTEEGNRIGSGLYGMRKSFGQDNPDVVESGKRLDSLLADYANYLQTEEYRRFVGPLTPKERLSRSVKAFLQG